MIKKCFLGLITGLFLVCGVGFAQATIVGFIELDAPTGLEGPFGPGGPGGPQLEPGEFGGPQLEPGGAGGLGGPFGPVELGGPFGPVELGGPLGSVELGGPQLEPDGPGGVLFGQSAPGETQSVPEPATMLLLGLGLVGFAGLKIREKK